MPKRGEFKLHKCCICHCTLTYKPRRLVWQEYNMTKTIYQNQINFDFCNNCFKKFINWIDENKEVKQK